MDENILTPLTELDDLVSDLGEIQCGFRCGVSLVSAVSDCFENIPNIPEMYIEALTAACGHLEVLQAQLETLYPRLRKVWETYKESEE